MCAAAHGLVSGRCAGVCSDVCRPRPGPGVPWDDGDMRDDADRVAFTRWARAVVLGGTGRGPIRHCCATTRRRRSRRPTPGTLGSSPLGGAGHDRDAAERASRVDPARTGGPVRPNERHARTSRLNTLSRQADAQRRRHAVAAALNVIYLRSDPLGRRSIRESAWISDSIAVSYGLLHSATHHPHDAQSSGDAFPDGGHKFAPTVSR